MSKKYTILKYWFNEEDLKDRGLINLYFENKGTKGSCWFSSLKVNISESLIGKYIPSIREFISTIQKSCLGGDPTACEYLSFDSLATVKTCPGVRGILSNSIVVKAPCDISITINSEGEWLYKASDFRLVELTEEHPTIQFGAPFNNKDSTLFKNKRIIKIKLPITISTDGDPYIHLHPQFHSDLPISVVNGVIETPYTEEVSLSIITFYTLPKSGSTLEIQINKGDALAYLWAPKPFKLKEVEPKVLKPKLFYKFIRRSYGDDSNS
jgi:hypothetical protein